MSSVPNTFSLKKGTRGQATIEFVLVLLFMLIMVASITIPLGRNLQFAMEDVSTAGALSSGIKQMGFAIDQMISSPTPSIRSVDLFLPKNTFFSCDPELDRISVTFPLHTKLFSLNGEIPPGCVENPSSDVAMLCTLFYPVPAIVDVTCLGDPTTDYTVETGAAGYVQSFRLGTGYDGLANPPFVLDVNTI